LFTKNEQVLLTQLKKTTRIHEYFANLNILQDFSQEGEIEGIQGHNVDTKVVEESPQSSAFEGTQSTSMKVIQASLMCNMLKYFGWMMQTPTINLVVILMFNNVYHNLVIKPHLGRCFLILTISRIHKHNCNLMNKYRSATFSNF
jgi:hypothetical protein